MNTLVDMISGMEVKEDDEDFMNAVDYMFAGLEKRKPDCFAVKQYKTVSYTHLVYPPEPPPFPRLGKGVGFGLNFLIKISEV